MRDRHPRLRPARRRTGAAILATVVLSGGQAVSSTGNEKAFRVVNSYPQSDLSGWSFRWAYSTVAGNSVNVTPYLLCAGAACPGDRPDPRDARGCARPDSRASLSGR